MPAVIFYDIISFNKDFPSMAVNFRGGPIMEKEKNVDINGVYIPSENIVAREIEGEIVIIPLTSGVGDMEDELYTLNETGKAVWAGLDGKRNLKALSEELSGKFDAPRETIEQDVTGLVEELLKRKMVVRANT